MTLAPPSNPSESPRAGQVRRVVSNDFALPGGTNRSWVIDRPFDVPLDASSFVSIVPFRGNIIVAGNRFADGGAIQLYAMAIDVAGEWRGAGGQDGGGGLFAIAWPAAAPRRSH